MDVGILGKKWVREVLQMLNAGPKGFNELMKAVSPMLASDLAGTVRPTVSSRTLSDRLEELQKEGIVSREVTNTKPPRSVYTITDKGKEVLVLEKKLSKL